MKQKSASFLLLFSLFLLFPVVPVFAATPISGDKVATVTANAGDALVADGNLSVTISGNSPNADRLLYAKDGGTMTFEGYKTDLKVDVTLTRDGSSGPIGIEADGQGTEIRIDDGSLYLKASYNNQWNGAPNNITGIVARNNARVIYSGDVTLVNDYQKVSGRYALPGAAVRVIDGGYFEMSGDIVVSGAGTGHGIYVKGDSSTVYMFGNITTNGSNTNHALKTEGGDSSIYMVGNISSGAGCGFQGGGKLFLSGDIETAGQWAYGIHATQVSSDITYIGNITTVGSSSSGVVLGNETKGTAKADITGNISATGEGSDGVSLSSNTFNESGFFKMVGNIEGHTRGLGVRGYTAEVIGNITQLGDYIPGSLLPAALYMEGKESKATVVGDVKALGKDAAGIRMEAGTIDVFGNVRTLGSGTAHGIRASEGEIVVNLYNGRLDVAAGNADAWHMLLERGRRATHAPVVNLTGVTAGADGNLNLLKTESSANVNANASTLY
ncbi:hypothetical protein LJC40_04700, partial [Synergistaceae bacterium OttesenSCG-928-D05]|nr:hypothetical protein [Synergistaceae bacterium OttesenSCG-928-D05]